MREREGEEKQPKPRHTQRNPHLPALSDILKMLQAVCRASINPTQPCSPGTRVCLSQLRLSLVAAGLPQRWHEPCGHGSCRGVEHHRQRGHKGAPVTVWCQGSSVLTWVTRMASMFWPEERPQVSVCLAHCPPASSPHGQSTTPCTDSWCCPPRGSE